MNRQTKIAAMLIACILIVCTGFVIMQFHRTTGNVVVVEQNGKELYRFSLGDTIEKRIETELGYNTLIIRDGQAFVQSADCAGQDCVHFAPIRQTGQSIVCLPHRITITVRGGNDAEQ